MRLAEGARALAAIALMIGAIAQADEPQYGKVETFQPGKKYSCVPTADHKGWDCNELAPGGAASKQGSNAPSVETTPLAPASATRAPEPMPSAPASTPAAPPTPAPAPDRPKSSGLPAYLRADSPTAPAAARPAPAAPPPPVATAPPAAAPAAPARIPESPAPTPTAAPPTPAVPTAPPAAVEPTRPATPALPAPVEAAAATPQPAPAAPVSTPRPAHEAIAAPPPREAEQPAPATAPSAKSEATPPSPVEAKPAPAPAKAAQAQSAPRSDRGNREFLALPASDYVIELAHSANAADLAALRATLQLPRGQLYELHLRRDNGDWWLLVWGNFDSVDAARAARAELPPDAAINAGWPRRIGALQSEARLVSSSQD